MCPDTTPGLTGSLPPADTTKKTLRVHGMTCASCVGRVEAALQALPGVMRADVNLVTGTATLAVRGSPIPVSSVQAALRPEGFDAESSEAVPTRGRQRRVAPLWKLILCLVLSILCATLAMAPALLGNPPRTASALLQCALALAVVGLHGLGFFRLAWAPWRMRRRLEMHALLSLGIVAALGSSVLAWVSGTSSHLHFESAAFIITFALIGRYLEETAKDRASRAVRDLWALWPERARVKRRGEVVEIATSELRVNDLLLVRSGERIGADGAIVSGESSVSEAFLTGESVPVRKVLGDRVVAGSVNHEAPLEVRVLGVAGNTELGRLVELVSAAQSSKMPVMQLVDRVASWFVPTVIGLAILSGGAWLLAGKSAAFALEVATTVLVIACPCALGLATPAALAVGIGRAARSGVVVRDATALQTLSSVRRVVFDKTGTLTRGEPVVSAVLPRSGVTSGELLSLAAALESEITHPYARAILREARLRKLDLPSVKSPRSWPGEGVTGVVGESVVRVGRRDWIQASLPASAAIDSSNPEETSFSEVWVARDDEILGVIALEDQVRKSAEAALNELAKLGVEPCILSGDRAPAVQVVASKLHINEWEAGLRPAEKLARLESLRSRQPVAMVGDGANDAPALAAASVGIAMGSGTAVAAEAAGLTILSSDLTRIPLAVRLARTTMLTIRQNLVLAFAYNLLALPLATGVLHPWTGHLVPPSVAAFAMAGSSLSVLANSLRARLHGSVDFPTRSATAG